MYCNTFFSVILYKYYIEMKGGIYLRKLTNEEFVQQIKDLVGDEYTFLEEYKGNQELHMTKHNKCGHKYPVKPANFKSGRRCPKCNPMSAKGLDHFVKGVYDLVSDEYIVIDVFRKKGKLHGNIRHSTCGKEYPVRYDAFVQKGDRCKCQNRKTHEEFVQELYKLHGDEYKLLGTYITSKDPVYTEHMICGYRWDVLPNALLAGKECPRCQNCERKTTERFKKQVFERVGDEYSVVSEYQGARENILMLHHKCGNEYPVTPDNFLSKNQRCPHCQDSKGNIEVDRVLSMLGVDYDREYRMPECKDKRTLPFDAVVFENREIKMLIEFDGIQHFKPSEFHGGEKGFKETRRRDEIKNDYCAKNEIPLIRIPYWEFDNIEKIIRHALKTLAVA
jgi:hypothetical protein